jgi:two-component system response regulator YesN
MMVMFKVLIAEDEPLERRALVYILQQSGLPLADISEAVNGRQAVAQTLRKQPEIIIMDIKMPGIDGLEAARRIKSGCPDCKIIFLTAYGHFDYAQQAIQIGTEDYIVKPVNREKLITVLQKVMNKLRWERDLIAKYQEATTKLQQVTYYYKSEILAAIIAEDIETNRVEEYISHLGISFGLGAAIVFHAVKLPDAKCERHAIYKQADTIVQELLAKHALEFLFASQHDYLYFLVIFDQEKLKEEWLQIVKEISAALRERVGCFQIGVSEIFDRLNLVNQAFFQARVACNNATDEVTVYREFLTDNTHLISYPAHLEKRLCEKIAKGDSNESYQAFLELWQWLKQNTAAFEELVENAYRLMIIVQRWANTGFNIAQGFNFSSYKDFAELKQSVDLKNYCWRLLSDLLAKIKKSMKEPSIKIIEEVCHYLGENYMNEIYLDNIACMEGFSRFYFSKLFKQCKGINFIDYLTMIRIDKSKELLKNPRLSVKDISYSVGYNDPNYYTSVFKKKEGISPTEYRNKCI